MRIQLAIVAVGLLGVSLLSGCTSDDRTPSAASTSRPSVLAPISTPSEVAPATAAAACAEEQQGQAGLQQGRAGLLAPAQVWPSSTYAEAGSQVFSLDPAACHNLGDALACDGSFPWVSLGGMMDAQANFLGEAGVRLWAYSELNGSAGSRGQGLTESITLFESAGAPGVKTILARAARCGLVPGSDGFLRGHLGSRQVELINLGQIQVTLELTGTWKPDEVKELETEAIAETKKL